MFKEFKTTVGKKLIMALTGHLLIIFVIAHVIGNSTIYFGGLNSYAQHLHDLAPLVWTFRSVMLITLLIHLLLGIQLTLENRASKPDTYAVKKSLRATTASRNMIWTGALTGGFLLYHLLHFTFQVTNPDISARANLDSLGRPDVMVMVVSSFQNIIISLVYIVSMAVVALHLVHGIQSSFQSLGLNNNKTLGIIQKAGLIVSIILFAGYALIPLSILVGMVKG